MRPITLELVCYERRGDWVAGAVISDSSKRFKIMLPSASPEREWQVASLRSLGALASETLDIDLCEKFGVIPPWEVDEESC